jgi:hypothetical protein
MDTLEDISGVRILIAHHPALNLAMVSLLVPKQSRLEPFTLLSPDRGFRPPSLQCSQQAVQPRPAPLGLAW